VHSYKDVDQVQLLNRILQLEELAQAREKVIIFTFKAYRKTSYSL